MNSREQILKGLAGAQFSAPLPDPPQFEGDDDSLMADFANAVEVAGGRVIETYADDVESEIRKLHPWADRIGSSTGLMPATQDLRPDSSFQVVGALELFVCFGEIGVAENGAVWVSDSRMQPRAALFATQHLVVVIRKSSLVRNMHVAYEQVQIDKEGFGVFVAGPSKTADIEQSLVIGAHGPRSLVVFVIE